MAPLTVDPAALDGAGTTLIDVGKDIGLALSTLTGSLSGCGGMCGDDPVGEAMGQSYDSAAASLVTAIAASRNGMVNLGDGVRMSAHNYSVAEAQSDGRGKAEPLPVPAASGAINAGNPPTSVGSGSAAPPGFGWVSKYIGMIWPTADSAQLRTAAGAWIAAGTSLLATQTAAAPALGVVGAQQIPEVEAMAQAFADSLNAASQVMSQTASIAATLNSYANTVDEVHAAITDLLARICDPMTGFKVVWDFLTDDEESEIKAIAEDIKTVVDNFSSQVSALAAEMGPMVSAAGDIAEGMLKYADREWEQFLQGNPVGQYLDDMAQGVKGFGLQGWELIEGSWTYSPQRAVIDPDGVVNDYKKLATGLAPLVGMDDDGWTGTGDAWKQLGKDTVHWDLWQSNPAEAFGRTLFDVGTFLVPGGGLTKVGTAGHAAVETAEAVARNAPRLPEVPNLPDPPKPPEAPKLPEPPKVPAGGTPASSPEPPKAPELKPGAPVSAPLPPQTPFGPTEHKAAQAGSSSASDGTAGSSASAPASPGAAPSPPPPSPTGELGSGGAGAGPSAGGGSPSGSGSPAPGGVPVDAGPSHIGTGANGTSGGVGSAGLADPPGGQSPHGPSGGGPGGQSPDATSYGGNGSSGDGVNNPPHTGLSDPPANNAPPGATLPDLTEINNEYRMPNGDVDPNRRSEWAQAVAEAYPSISKDGVEGVYRYTTQDYAGMNDYLRGAEPFTGTAQLELGVKSVDDLTPEQRGDLESKIRRTDEGLSALPPYRENPTDLSSTTWRGLHATDDLVAQLEQGKTFSDHGYFSSSTNEFIAESFARGAPPDKTPVVLTVEGQNGVDVAQLSRYTDEAEILFPRSSRFEVVSAEPDENGVMRVVLKQIEE